MSNASEKPSKPKVDKAVALELLFSALGYLRGAGINVRGSNIGQGLALVIEDVFLNERGLPVVADVAITGKPDRESDSSS
jgi:hypothetical protein